MKPAANKAHTDRAKLQQSRTDALRSGDERLITLAEYNLKQFDLEQERAGLLAADAMRRDAEQQAVERAQWQQEQIADLEALQTEMVDKTKALEKIIDALPKQRADLLATASAVQEIMSSLGHAADVENPLRHSLDICINNRLHNSGFVTARGTTMAAPPSIVEVTANFVPGQINHAKRMIARG